MDIKDLRDNIDRIDADLIKLFAERMETAAKIADYKKQNNLPILNAEREKEVVEKVVSAVPKELQEYAETLYKTIFELSRSYQISQE